MKQFFKTYSYDALKMFLNQFGTAIFGFALSLAAAKAQNAILRNVLGVVAVLFYLFLLYTMTWDVGFRDRVSVTQGKKANRPARGFLISLLANTPNFLFAICITLGCFFGSVSFFGGLGGIASFCALLLEGMYTGLLANHFMGNALNSYWWVWFLTPLPSIITCGIAYLLGIKDCKLSVLIFGKQQKKSHKESKN